MGTIPTAILDHATDAAVALGGRILQGCRFGATDEEHVGVLLKHMDPGEGWLIADIGCGLGEVARLMKEQRSDLDFILVNDNAKQLDSAPPDFRTVQSDMHAMPIEDGAVDCAMFCFSLCHANFAEALSEAARITRTGGLLFVYDYDRLRGANDLMFSRLGARALPFHEMTELAERAGWTCPFYDALDGDDSLFRAAYANDAEYDLIFNDLVPAVWSMARCS